MSPWAKKWGFWIIAISLGASVGAAVIWLHQIMPGEDTLVLSAGTFSPTCEEAARNPPTQPVSLPDDWHKRALKTSCGWYRFELSLEVAPDRLWALYIPALEMSHLISVNSVIVGGAGNFDNPLPRYWNRPVQVLIPSGLLKPGNNVVEVRLHANGPWGRLYNIYLGPEADLSLYYRLRHLLRVELLYVTTVVSLMISLFIGALTFVRREPVYGAFAGFAAAWCVQNWFTATVDLPVPNVWWDWVAYTLYGWMAFAGTIFTFRYLGLRSPRWERTVLSLVAIGPLCLAAAMTLGSATFNALGSNIWLFSLMLAICYPAATMALSLLRQRNLEVFALTVCYCLTVVLAAHDWLVTSGLGYRHNGFLLQFAAPPMLVTFGVILMRRFILALRETDLLNQELELRIDHKTREIAQAYERTRDLEQQTLLTQERERIMRDMHDGVGSQLIASLARLDRGSSRDAPLAAELEGALLDLRMMIDSLDHVEGDIGAALGLFRNRMQPLLDANGISLEWQVGDTRPIAELGPERVLNLLRILQEAVTNAIRHSGADRLSIRTLPDTIVMGEPCIAVEVVDNGCGLEKTNGYGRGLKNMRYRAAAASLLLEIESGEGTTIRVGVPLDSPRQPDA